MHITFTPPRDRGDALRQAAVLWGIEAEYWDIWGKHHVVDGDVIVSILTTLGVACGSVEELTSAIEARVVGSWASLAPATVVAFEDEVRVPLGLAAGLVEGELTLEDGTVERFSIEVSGLPVEETAEMGGVRYEKRRLELKAGLGYHTLKLTAGEMSRTVNVVVCPRRAYLPLEEKKLAGVGLSLYGLRSKTNWGCGDFSNLEQAVEWAAGEGLGFVALNPLHAIPNRQPYNTSPYLPTSILYRNILYLDVTAVADWRGRREPSGAAALRGSEFVEYEKVYRLKRKALRAAFRTFLRTEWTKWTERASEFQKYLDGEGESLKRFAVYCALDEWIHREDPSIWLWTDWPACYQQPQSAEVEEFAQKHWRMVLFYQYAQWQVDSQLARVQARTVALGMPIGLYHDLALATDRTGADVWAHPSFFMKGCRVGSPPDDFAPEGQDWAFPPPNTLEHYENGYKLFAEGIRKTARHGGALRIDHVMRLFRLFWIPDGCKASTGAYVKDHAADLLKILALESVRGKMLVVGEDLGTVSDETRAELYGHGILSYRLFFFEKHGDGRFKAAAEYPAQALAATTTHDLPTLAGFWSGHDITVRREVGQITDEEGARAGRLEEKRRMADVLGLPESAAGEWVLPDAVLEAVIGFLASTPCLLFCLNQEDLTRSEEQLNLPGTTSEHPNWRRKMAYGLEDLDSAPGVRAMRKWLVKTGGRE